MAVVVITALCLVFIAILRTAIIRRGGRREAMPRATLAILLGVASVVVGGGLRASSSSIRDAFLLEVGFWSIGFGLAVIVVTIGVWVSRDLRTLPRSSEAENDMVDE